MAPANESKRRPPPGPGADEPGVAAQPLSPGLWLVATPIGNAADITLRALDVLRRADVLACEDTRRTRKLLEIHGISLAGRPVLSYNDQNGAARRPEILRHLAAGRSVAYASDAGTPLIADPGYRLVTEARAEGHDVHVAPGPSAVLAALSVAGLPTDRFLFAGFLPVKSAARKREAAALAGVPATLVFFEAPRRLAACLADLAEALGEERPAAVVREITKLHEETVRGTLGELARRYADLPAPRGEAVLVIGPPGKEAGTPDAEGLDRLIRQALDHGSVKDAAREVAAATGLPRREVYARAVEIAGETGR